MSLMDLAISYAVAGDGDTVLVRRETQRLIFDHPLQQDGGPLNLARHRCPGRYADTAVNQRPW
ncbi:hypothetical protein [Nonomuraea guangzhouensis]|uniref:Uncharacterized protein n=1 Tax=Nonomuraea guangzhouensis TaxID=1291555 RepID=A0ABW4G5L5_9ACTN|nr:hypothetical protein [Nonomuraea guangzhouensis]